MKLLFFFFTIWQVLVLDPRFSESSPAKRSFNKKDSFYTEDNYEFSQQKFQMREDENHLSDIEMESLDFVKTWVNTDITGERQVLLTSVRNVVLGLSCDACKSMVFLVQHLIGLNFTKEKIIDAATSLCITFHIESDRICEGIIEVFQVEVFTVLEKLALSPEEVCGIIIGDDCATAYNPFEMWNVTFPKIPKPPVKPLTPPKPQSPTLRVLQLTDMHVDFQYKIGSNADCDEPICCRSNDGPVGIPAGRWGDYHSCDIPTWTVEHALQYLSSNDKFDYIVYTGDLPAHDDWNQTRDSQIEHVKYLTKVLRKYFPTTPVYPSLGNHESVPVNSFPPPFVKGENSMKWLYDVISKEWSTWLPNDTMADILRGGYYSVIIKPGYRIVSLNSNYCNNENWWLLINMTDPAGELQWLINILQHAENVGEKVHIIGHIPPGDAACVKAWSWNFYKVVDRYESTITSQLYGHTHNDEMQVFYDLPHLTRATGVAYIAPSLTTAPSLNPAYRVYTIDGFHQNTTFAVLDHETYILNLTEANTQDNPKWQKEYSAKEAFNMSSVFPADWDKFLRNLLHDNVMFQKYYTYFYSSRPPKPCNDTKCIESFVCKIRMGRSHDPDLCKDLVPTLLYQEYMARVPRDPYDVPRRMESRARQKLRQFI